MESTTMNLKGRAPIDKPLQRYTLTVLSGPAMGTRAPLVQPRTTIGRSRSADITIDDVHLSRYHLEIEVLPRDRGLIVRDLRSKNGTYVRNCRIIEAFIEEQGYIEVGEQTVLEVSLPYMEVTGYPRHGFASLDDVRLRASGVLRPTSPAAPRSMQHAGSRATPEEIPTGTLVIPREELAAELAARLGKRKHKG